MIKINKSNPLNYFYMTGDEQNKIARIYFGYKPNRHTKLLQGDGVVFMRKMLEDQTNETLETCFGHMTVNSVDGDDARGNGKIDVILIDADSKDTTLSMTAPPPEFVTDETVKCMYDLLSDHGMLVVNVVARVDSLFYETGETIRQVFESNGCVYMMKANDETMNRAFVAVKGKNEDSLPKWKVLDAWLKSVGLVYDPLELHDTVDMFEVVKKLERMDDMD